MTEPTPGELALPVAASDVTDAPLQAVAPERRRSPDLGLIIALWRRDLIHLRRESTRWIGVVAQPLLLWLLLGSGMAGAFTVAGAEGLDTFAYLYPGFLVMVVLFTTIFATMAVIEDRQHGFLQQVLTAPGSRLALVLGKTAGVGTVALAQVVLTLLVAPAAGFSLLEVHWPLLIGTFVFGTAGLCGMSFCLAWVLRSTHAYHGIMAVLLLPMWLVSGAMFPPQGGWLDAVMVANPMTYMVDGFRHALHGGEAPVSFSATLTSLAVLAGFAVVMLACATLLQRRPTGKAT